MKFATGLVEDFATKTNDRSKPNGQDFNGADEDI